MATSYTTMPQGRDGHGVPLADRPDGRPASSSVDGPPNSYGGAGYGQPSAGQAGYGHGDQPHVAIPVQGGAYGEAPVASGGTLESRHVEILGLARATRWFAIFDMILCILFAFSGFGWIALVAMIGPILGFIGGRTYRPFFVFCYIVFELLLITFRILGLIFFYGNLLSLILSIVIIICEIFILRIITRFWLRIRRLSSQEIYALRGWYHHSVPIMYW